MIHMSLCMLSHITAWTQERPLLPALRNSGRFLTIPLILNLPLYQHGQEKNTPTELPSSTSESTNRD